MIKKKYIRKKPALGRKQQALRGRLGEEARKRALFAAALARSEFGRAYWDEAKEKPGGKDGKEKS